MEKQSEHPLAEAVVKYFKDATSIPLQMFNSITGKGVKASCDHETYFVGNRNLLGENDIAIARELSQQADEWEHGGVACRGGVCPGVEIWGVVGVVKKNIRKCRESRRECKSKKKV